MELPTSVRTLYEDTSELIVIQKAAQMGISEYLINAALWTADTAQGGRGVALYLMPTQQTAHDFAQARIEHAVFSSPYLTARVRPRRAPGGAARADLRRIGDGYVYVRGSDSERQLITVDADTLLLDEVDQMSDGVIEKALHRLDSSTVRRARLVSTPTVPGYGINDWFQRGDQRCWFIRCQACKTDQTLAWQENVNLDLSTIVCRRCRRPLDTQAEGVWVPARTAGAEFPSYHLSQLYSPHLRLDDLITASRSANPLAVQEFFNSSLGLPYQAEGGGLTPSVLDACQEDERLWPSEGGIAMGVDVGSRCHYVIRRKVEENFLLLKAGEVDSLDDTPALITAYGVQCCVVDALPETHLALRLQTELAALIYLAYYDEHATQQRWEHGSVHVNRTIALDEVVARFESGANRLPLGARYLGGSVRGGTGNYYRQLLALTRSYTKNAAGHPVARYTGSADDHYFHAEAYCVLALSRTYSGSRMTTTIATSRSRLAGLGPSVVSRRRTPSSGRLTTNYLRTSDL